MTPDEAQKFLSKALRKKPKATEEISAANLLHSLTYVPLTIGQAADYMNKKNLPISAYLYYWHSEDEKIMALLSRMLSPIPHHSILQSGAATTCIISFEAICREDAEAAYILSFIQWIDCKAIPRMMLPISTSEMDLTDSIRTICGYGFLSWRADIREVGLNKDEAMLRLGEKAGYCLKLDSRIKEAVQILQDVVAVREETLAETHPDRLASQHQLASTYLTNGQIKEAIKLFEHIVAVREETLEETHLDRLASQHQLAVAYLTYGQIEEAIKLFEHVVAVQKETLAETHPDRLASQHQLAVAYLTYGQIEEAIKLFEHVVAVKTETLAETDPSRLVSQHQLAAAYGANGQLKEAIKLTEHAVTVQKETLAETHPSRLASQHQLASAHGANGLTVYFDTPDDALKNDFKITWNKHNGDRTWLRLNESGDNNQSFIIFVDKIGNFRIRDRLGDFTEALQNALQLLPATATDSIPILIRRLEHLAKFQATKELTNPDAQYDTPSALISVKVDTAYEGQALASGQWLPPAKVRERITGVYELDELTLFRIVICNQSGRSLGCVVLDCGAEYGIERVFPRDEPYYELHPAETKDVYFWMQVAPELRAAAEDGIPIVDTLKIFVCDPARHIYSLRLRGLKDMEDGTRSGERSAQDLDALNRLGTFRLANSIPTRDPLRPSWGTVDVKVRIKLLPKEKFGKDQADTLTSVVSDRSKSRKVETVGGWTKGDLESRLSKDDSYSLTNYDNFAAQKSVQSHSYQTDAAQESIKIEHNAFSDIKNILCKELQGNLINLSFKVRWELPEFVETELDGNWEIGSFLTMNGSSHQPYAAPCDEYVNKFWPTIGFEAVGSIITSTRALSENASLDEVRLDINMDPDLHLNRIYKQTRLLNFEVSGTQRGFIEFAQLLAWLSAVFRKPQYGAISSSSVEIKKYAIKNNTERDNSGHVHEPFAFEVNLRPLQGIEADDATSCWRPLFNNTVIAEGFPIRKREHELGLELPFNAMLTLSSAPYYLLTPRGILFKGYSTALVPRSRPNEKSIQWHLIQSSGNQGKLNMEEIRQIPEADEKFLDVNELSCARTFLGYDTEIRIVAGTQQSQYESAVLTDAERDSASLMVGTEFSPTVGFSKLGTIGLGTKITYAKGVYAGVEESQNHTDDRLLNSRASPLLMYDVQHKTGFLIPEICAILEIAHVWANRQTDGPDILQKMPFSQLRWDGGQACGDIIEQFKNLQL
ncbi:hypothetical protein QQS21_009049 [Conoideocrella luteorostrata]|uniref:Uncharacterized protein n=1 Tax=Conoideocrella luteorostrata TaxID=1105319 RepID=A0AAJ0FY54_9HYPO|nr:hypothetical protein QQS21_009049 [Conoideocrella luteorostrata]